MVGLIAVDCVDDDDDDDDDDDVVMSMTTKTGKVTNFLDRISEPLINTACFPLP